MFKYFQCNYDCCFIISDRISVPVLLFLIEIKFSQNGFEYNYNSIFRLISII